jgi:hypothetical protein
MRVWLPIVLSATLALSSCALLGKAPQLTPQAGTALTNGLAALSAVLQQRGDSPAAVTAITDVQQEIAADTTGTTWGALVRNLLTDLYTQLPTNVQDDAVVWAALSAVEIVLATVGA